MYGEGLLTQRSRPYRATRHPHLHPPPELCSPHLTHDRSLFSLGLALWKDVISRVWDESDSVGFS